MTHDYRDQPISVLLPEIEALKKAGAIVWLKWTCPACGERCISDDFNGFHLNGYRHDEKKDGSPCGAVYIGDMFGFAVLFRMS